MNDVLTLVTTVGGPVGALGWYMFFMERKDRKSGDKERVQMMERMIIALEKTGSALNNFEQLIGHKSHDSRR